MILAGAVGLIDDGGQGAGFAAARGAGHQNQPLGQGRQLHDDRGQPQIVGRGYDGGNGPEGRAYAPLLVEKIGPVAGKAGQFIAEIHIARFLKNLYLFFWRDFIEHLLQFGVFQNFIPDFLHLPPQPDQRLVVGRQMQIGRADFIHQFKKSVYLGHVGKPLKRMKTSEFSV